MDKESRPLSAILNKAIGIAPVGKAEKRKDAYKALASSFWETMLQGSSGSVAEFNNLMNFLLLSNKKDRAIDRAVWFVSFVVGGLLGAPARKCFEFANGFLINLADRSTCTETIVRIRCCQFIRMTLAEFSEDVEIDVTVAETLQSSLLERLKDRSAEVRVQSIYALERFTSPGPKGDFSEDEVTDALFGVLKNDPYCMARAASLNCLPVTSKLCQALVEKVRDISDVVRANVFKLLQRKVNPKMLDTRDRCFIVTCGLRERCEIVRQTAKSMLIHWFNKNCNRDFEAFFSLFDVEKERSTAVEALEALLEDPEEKANIVVYVRQGAGLKSKKLMMTSEALFWRVFCLKIKSEADRCAREAVIKTTGVKAESDVARSEALLDLLETILPESVSHFIEIINLHLDSGNLLSACELMNILQKCVSLADAAERGAVADFIGQIFFKLFDFPMSSQWEVAENVTALAWLIWSNFEEFSSEMCKTLFALAEHFQIFKDTSSDISQLLSWSITVREILRLLPCNVKDAGSRGHIEFRLSDLAQGLVSIFHRYQDPEIISITIENLGLFSHLELTDTVSEMILPLIARSLDLDCLKIKKIAVRVLCSLSMSYGIRKIDKIQNITEHSVKSQEPLWKHKFKISDGLVLKLLKMLPENIGPRNSRAAEEDSIETEIIESLTKLMILNRFMANHGLTESESVKVLTTFLVYLADTGNDRLEKIHQILLVFFESFMQMHSLNQIILQLAFLPALYASLLIPEARREGAIRTITNVSSFLKIYPKKSKALSGHRMVPVRETDVGQCQLACVVLWEITHCPNARSIKSYTTALWKFVAALQFDSSTANDIYNLKRLIGFLKPKLNNYAKELQSLEGKLDDVQSEMTQEVQGPLEEEHDNEEFKDMIYGLEILFVHFGLHPLLQEKD